MNGIDPASLFMLVNLIYCFPGIAGISQTWLQFRDSYYFVNAELMLWEDATSFCRQLNGSLAFPDSQDEQEFLWGIYLKHFAPKTSTNFGPWIGCDDRDEEGEWHCITNYSNWAGDQPDNWLTGEDCAEFSLYWNGKWNDVPCDQNRFSVCEVSAGESWAVCRASTGAGFADEAQCVFDSAVDASAVKRVLLGWRACRYDGQRRSFKLLRPDTGEVVCQLIE